MEKRFGASQVVSLGTFTTFQLKAAITDLARCEGIPVPIVKRMTAKLGDEGEKTVEDLFRTICSDAELREFAVEHVELFNDAFVILGNPKAASVHACGTCIFPEEKAAYQWAPMKTRNGLIVTEWEGEEIEHAGFLKEDILGIAQLDKLAAMLKLIKKHYNIDIDLYKDIPLDDPKVFEYVEKGYLGDVFHFGAKGLSGYCIQMCPNSLSELSACAALYRPGPIENNIHNEYILRKNGEVEVTYPIGSEDVLKDDFGLMVYQESIMRLCQQLADFDLEETDAVRKVLGKKLLDKAKAFGEKFEKGYIDKYGSIGVTEEYAKNLWKQMVEFAKYAFNKCISGRESFYRHSNNKESYKPTIEEMYKIRNDKAFAKASGHESLHGKYKNRGYGTAWTLCEDGRLRLSNIKDITFAGTRQTYKITLENGASICTTDNHKFPTQRGRIILSDLIIGEDSLYYNGGYEQEESFFIFTDKSNSKKAKGTQYHYELNSEKGKIGFQKKTTSFTDFRDNSSLLRKDINKCQICNKQSSRLEVHHLDGDHGNNELDNLCLLCPSCHKKEHYRSFNRKKTGEKGLTSKLIKIKSIEPECVENVYDVEIDHPEHNFTTNNGIVTCNSHSVAYARNGYNCLWLKVHYPLEFWSVTLSNADLEDFSFYVNEIQSSGGVTINPVSINKSDINIVSDEKTNNMYWAINSVKQVGEKAQEWLINERNRCGEFFSLDEFIDRCVEKGSPINKSVIENLIYSGAFDKLESIDQPYERLRLLEAYRVNRKVKIIEEKDILTNIKRAQKETHNWWWQLQQKRLSGFAFFDYESLVDQYLIPKLGRTSAWFMTATNLKRWEEGCNQEVVTGGYVLDIQERKSKKGYFANIILESNYEFIKIMVFPELYEEYREFLKESKGNLLLLNGYPTYNKFHNAYVLQTTANTQLVVLS